MKGTDTQATYFVSDVQSPVGIVFDQDKIDLIKRTLARGTTDDELSLFIEQCRRTGLDPFARQIYSVRRKQWSSASRSYEEAQVIQVSIDGFRLIADRTRKYAGQVGPWWCGPDGEWQEVWLSSDSPAAARVGVLRHDFHQPLYAVALFKSYVQTNSYGEPISRWKTDPAGMIAKCAEALALRRAFPQELSGLYTTEEMGQADNPQPDASTSSLQDQDQMHSSRLSGQRPYSPEELKANFARAVNTIIARGMAMAPDDSAVVASALENMLESPDQISRYLEFVSGFSSLEEMGEPEIIALSRLLKPVITGGKWIPTQEAIEEASEVIAVLDEMELSASGAAETQDKSYSSDENSDQPELPVEPAPKSPSTKNRKKNS